MNKLNFLTQGLPETAVPKNTFIVSVTMNYHGGQMVHLLQSPRGTWKLQCTAQSHVLTAWKYNRLGKKSSSNNWTSKQ